MIINEFTFRNFKSYGNITQTIKLKKDKGELTLLVGDNGSGKSSLLETLEYTLYNVVKSNKKKKKATLSSLPNRINGDMLCTVDMDCGSDHLTVKRGIQPSILELIENDVENERAGKANIDDIIESYIGMDIDTFKSFISMSINDFKNFISLSNEDKQLLLDKLFNLEIINILNKILKDIVSKNKKDILRYDTEIATLEQSISNIKNSIAKSIVIEQNNDQAEIEELKEAINSRKEEFNSLKEKIEKIEAKEIELREQVNSERESFTKIKYELNTVQKELDLYDQGKCPTCASDFHTEHFMLLKQTLIEKKQSLHDHAKEIETKGKMIKEREIKLAGIAKETRSLFNDIKVLLGGYKNKIASLQNKQINESTSASIVEFEKSLKDFENRKKSSGDQLNESKQKESYYKELSKVLGEDGVKKNIISGIVKPINYFIQENLKLIDFPYQVKLDETFTATITTMSKEIEQDSLSTGENKIINVCIMLAYLNLIRTKKYVNILFLDEVFSSIDLKNIDKILRMLKNFANEHKVNIFVVHHAVLKEELFDRIIEVNKNVFSFVNYIK